MPAASAGFSSALQRFGEPASALRAGDMPCWRRVRGRRLAAACCAHLQTVSRSDVAGVHMPPLAAHWFSSAENATRLRSPQDVLFWYVCRRINLYLRLPTFEKGASRRPVVGGWHRSGLLIFIRVSCYSMRIAGMISSCSAPATTCIPISVMPLPGSAAPSPCSWPADWQAGRFPSPLTLTYGVV
jgi:hypothetical protein